VSEKNQGERLPGTPMPRHIWEGFEGVPIAGDTWGDPDGPLVVLLHGGGQTRHAWKNTGELLAEAGYRAVAFDARGHGDSGWAPPGHYGVDANVGDLIAVVRALGGERPILIGASMGGSTSLVAIGEDRVEATALVLVDIAPHTQMEGVRQIQEFMDQRPEGFETLEDVAEAIANYQPHRPRPRRLDGLAKNVRLGEDGRYRWHWDPEWRRNRPASYHHRQRLHDCADRLHLPVLLVRGALSNVIDDESVERFLAQCPHAEYVNVADAAHMVAGDKNDLFADSAIEFLARVAPPQG